MKKKNEFFIIIYKRKIINYETYKKINELFSFSDKFDLGKQKVITLLNTFDGLTIKEFYNIVKKYIGKKVKNDYKNYMNNNFDHFVNDTGEETDIFDLPLEVWGNSLHFVTGFDERKVFILTKKDDIYYIDLKDFDNYDTKKLFKSRNVKKIIKSALNMGFDPYEEV